MADDDLPPSVTTHRVVRNPNRDTSAAVAVKKAQAADNRRRIAEAIVSIQRDDKPVNVTSVARAAKVSPDTIRRNPDLLKEIAHLRDRGWQRKSGARLATVDKSTYDALRGRWLTAQSEVSRLRKELAEARRAVHQALGTQMEQVDPAALDQLESENADLRVRFMELTQEVQALKDERTSLAGELSATHEINREYVRELNLTKDRLLHAERELSRLRLKQGE